jgi:hypothetical protein
MDFALLKQNFITTISSNINTNIGNDRLAKINSDLALLQRIDNPRKLYGYILMGSIAYRSVANYIHSVYGIQLNDDQIKRVLEFQQQLEAYVEQQSHLQPM